jgi:hypothetical protein
MFEDIYSIEETPSIYDDGEMEAAFALLTKYLVKHIDSINEGNIKEHIKYWIVEMVDDGVNYDQVMEFKEHLRGYIPDAVH